MSNDENTMINSINQKLPMDKRDKGNYESLQNFGYGNLFNY